MKKIIINKYTKYLIAFIGVFSSVVGLIQFYTLNTYPVLRGNFCLTNNTDKGRLIEFVQKITRNSGDILYFDDVIIQDYCDPHENNLHQNDDGNYVLKKENDDMSVVSVDYNEEVGSTYAFNFYGFVSNKDISTETDDELYKATTMLLEEHNITYDEKDIKQFEVMWLVSMSGYNVHITLNSNNMSQNQYSAINGVQEGQAILITGPFQIKDTSGGEHIGYELSAPVIDSDAKKQIECTKKDWGRLRKALLCPFI